jgi:Ni/Fe-hydrogenase subunit HybB-like protein
MNNYDPIVQPVTPDAERSAAISFITGEHTYASVTEKITGDVLVRPIQRLWMVGAMLAFLLLNLLMLSIAYLLYRGVGIWGINIPVGWGFAITNFVWWVGIGHAGTFISAFLYLMHQSWRTSINRFAEAMTLFAVACAGLFPLLHMGRPWFFYWLLPYPDTMGLWPQFRSPLVWDVFAVSTYLLVSLMFWYVGLIPDVASMRDEARKPWQRVSYGILALGWRGSARHWARYQSAYMILAGLATPLVVSVHSVVSMDFAAGVVPGWHSTIFPPFFVAGAILSGFAMVISIAIPLRKYYGLEAFITLHHLENCAKLLLVTSMIVTYSYVMEDFTAWYSGNPYDKYVQINRAFGGYWPAFWLLMFCNVATPQFLWFKKLRTSIPVLFVVSLIIQVGMWTERYVIVVTSLHEDFMPSAWGTYHGTFWDWATLLGSIGLFMFLFILFVRILPSVAMAELRELVHKTGPHQPAVRNPS